MPAIATDDFNRADDASLGSNWTIVPAGALDNAGMQIVSNACTFSNIGQDAFEMYTGVAFPDDQYAQARMTVTGTGAGSGPAVCVRSLSDGSCYRAAVNKAASNNVEVVKIVAVTFTTLGFRTTTWVDGDILRIEVQGTTIRVLQNGVQLGADFTDSVLTTGPPGVGYSTTVTSASLDDWEGGSFPETQSFYVTRRRTVGR